MTVVSGQTPCVPARRPFRRPVHRFRLTKSPGFSTKFHAKFGRTGLARPLDTPLNPPSHPPPLPPAGEPADSSDRLRSGLQGALVAIPAGLLFLEALVRATSLPVVSLVGLVCSLGLAGWSGAAVATLPFRIRRATALGLCLVYFAPFLHWFLQKPSVYYLAVNVFLMLLCAGWWMVQFNENLAQHARDAGDHAFRRDAMFCAWASLILFSILEIFLVAQVLWHQMEIGGHRFPHVMLAPWRSIFLIPFAFTWITAARAYARLAAWVVTPDRPEPQSGSPGGS